MKGGGIMKINKKLIAFPLVFALTLTSLVTATFSWYDHSGTNTGREMRYKRDDLPVSAGTVSLVTKKYLTENNRLKYDEKGNKKYVGEAISGDTVSNKTTQYYGTTITNSGTAPAYINVYLSGFTHDSKNFIGTIEPSLTHKGLSSSVHIANKSMIRVYFQWDKANNWSAPSAKNYVVYTTKSGEKGCVEFDKTNNVIIGSALLKNVTTYYADLPDNTTEFYFATDGAQSGFNTETLEVTQAWYRTKTITNVHAETGYYLTGYADDTTWNAQYVSFGIPGGVSVKTYFDTATISAGQNAYITLAQGTNYTGASATYEVNSGNVTVNRNTGFVTANSSFGVGSTAVVTTTIHGALGDTTSFDTTITNPSTVSAATVALNVKVDGATEDGAGTAEIVWYIKNDSGNDCVFNDIYYTK